MQATRDSRTAKVVSLLCVIALFGTLLAIAMRSHTGAGVHAIELHVSDIKRSEAFFVSVLGFEPTAASKSDAGKISLIIRLGEETIVLRQLETGRTPIRTDHANDASFQHIAIVVADMDRAYERLRDAGVAIVSDGPQRLPDWNWDAAGIRAVYFRDPDGHFLELIQFPRFKGEPVWQGHEGRLFLGIDHTAMVVSDTARSVAFYRDKLRLTQIGESLNSGVEQQGLSGVDGAKLRITGLRGTTGPGVELLQYIEPSTPRGSAANDWTLTLSGDPAAQATTDPDGHVIATKPVVDTALAVAVRTLRRHWTRYVMEAAELGIFMVVTLWFTLLLEHPASPVRRRIESGLARRVVMGMVIGGTVIGIIMSPFGRASGAHFNPSVTLAMLSLGRIGGWDATFYVIAQFIGGALGVALAALPFLRASGHEKVNFAATLPGPNGVSIAIIGEIIISFALLAVLLSVQGSPSLKPYAGYFAGGLLLIYITLEAPLSGMSMNPARTVASAIFARRVGSIWPYFIAPIPAMLLAARLFGN